MNAEQALAHPWFTSGQVTDAALPNDVVNSLYKFATSEKFKRLALQAVAFSAQYEDIKELHRLFNEIDADNDGYLTLSDLEDALLERGDIDRKTVQSIFGAMDIDKQGKIHLTQFVAATMTESQIRNENLLCK